MSNTKEKYDKLYKKLAQDSILKKNMSFNSKGKIFPSSSGVNCELNLRYSFTGTEKSYDFIWHGCENKIGDAIHAVIQNQFIEAFKDNVEIEKYITHIVEGIKINAKVDIILLKKQIIEIKTVKSEEGKEPDPAHIKQVQWYMGITGLKTAIISYFNREKGTHINSFEIEFNQREFDKIVEKFARVIRGDKNLRSDTRECKFCPYKKTCSSYKAVPKWGNKKED